VAHHNLFRAFRSGPINSEHVIGNSEQSVERRLDGIAAVYGHIAMQNFLQYFGVDNQAFPAADEGLDESLGVGLV
jgi:hypothetical protein